MADKSGLEAGGYWDWLSGDQPAPYEIAGKYLFFSLNRNILLSIARNEIKRHGFHLAKVNTHRYLVGKEYVLCLYYKDPSRKIELAKRYKNAPGVKYRGWKSNAATERGEYSPRFLLKLSQQAPHKKANKRAPRKALRLPIELIPSPLWGRSLAKLGSTDKGQIVWERIREVEMRRTGRLCEVCGEPAHDVHEKWEYDDQRNIQ